MTEKNAGVCSLLPYLYKVISMFTHRHSLAQCVVNFTFTSRRYSTLYECEKILLDAENTIAPRHKTSLGLELLRGSPSDVAALAARVGLSLQEELEDPPERFRDPVSYAMMVQILRDAGAV